MICCKLKKTGQKLKFHIWNFSSNLCFDFQFSYWIFVAQGHLGFYLSLWGLKIANLGNFFFIWEQSFTFLSSLIGDFCSYFWRNWNFYAWFLYSVNFCWMSNNVQQICSDPIEDIDFLKSDARKILSPIKFCKVRENWKMPIWPCSGLIYEHLKDFFQIYSCVVNYPA